MRFRYKVRVVVGVIMAVLGILFTLQNFGRPARVHQLRDNAVSGFYERRFSGGDRRLRDLIDRGMHFTPDYPTSCGWPVRLPRRVGPSLNRSWAQRNRGLLLQAGRRAFPGDETPSSIGIETYTHPGNSPGVHGSQRLGASRSTSASTGQPPGERGATARRPTGRTGQKVVLVPIAKRASRPTDPSQPSVWIVLSGSTASWMKPCSCFLDAPRMRFMRILPIPAPSSSNGDGYQVLFSAVCRPRSPSSAPPT